MDWTLVIHRDADMAATMAELLRGVVPGKPVATTNLADARAAMLDNGRAHCNLVVTSLSPPADADHPTPYYRDAPTIVAFLQEARAGRQDLTPGVILLVSTNDGARIAELQAMGNILSLQVATAARDLEPAARRLLYPSAASANRYRHEVDVDITLSHDGLCSWSVKGAAMNSLEDSGVIRIAPEDFYDLLMSSRATGRPRSDEAVRWIGRKLYGHIMADLVKTDSLEQRFRARLSEPGRNDAARFRFLLDEETNALLVEALGKPRDGSQHADLEYWMLESPIFRKFGSRGERPALFKDRLSRLTPVRCLVIEGETGAFSAGGAIGRSFPRLLTASSEVDWIEAYFRDHCEPFGLAPPVVLRHRDHPGPGFGARVRDTLRAGEWQLIHYVGHSALGSDRRAYLALGGGAEECLVIDEFADLASHAQFMFLNSCRSGDARFIMKLVGRNIPAVAGYAWPIEDEVASLFARSFYENLFGNQDSKRFIEYAFMRAKRALHQDQRFIDQPVWTAPLLYMQMRDCELDSVRPAGVQQ